MFEKSPEGYFRVNLHWKSTHKTVWVSNMINDVSNQIADEYQMKASDNRQAILYPKNTENRMSHLVNLIKIYTDIEAIPYDAEGDTESYGLLFKADDPNVVKCILKYS